MMQRTMTVAGVMSGTSADGVDVAICSIGARTTEPSLKLLAHHHVPYSKPLRAAVLAAMDAKRTSTAELARLHWRLGGVYADAVEAALEKGKNLPAKGAKESAKVRGERRGLDLIAMHGQTLYHQGVAQSYLGAPVRCTWQAGEASVIVERLRVPVVSDFRPADIAAEGQGAPLVPMLDFAMFRSATRNRLLLNLGGIANVTALPASCDATRVIAFDTGPANMVIDALMQRLFARGYDRGGAVARRGVVLDSVVTQFLGQPYFAAAPPKSTGREQFGEAFAASFLAACRSAGGRKTPQHDADVIATATAFTARSIADAYARFVWPHFGTNAPGARGTDLIAAGGGTENAPLMRMLVERFTAFGISVSTTAAHSLPSAAKEAAAFALLGWLTWHRIPGNVPSATGAAHAAILGKVTYA